ncbi:MAG: phospho-sugar mutase [Clostridiales bacterium]|nr:phospho-sugar mutase [Clostridiales bacterium]
MSVKELYELWRNRATGDPDLMEELQSISKDEDGIYDRFYRELEFGTAGLRGVIGAGTNRMNIYTVRQTTQGLANYLKSRYDNPAVAIAYDSRIKAKLFAEESARVLAANGVKAYLAKELQPTPLLSFAVRSLCCQSGIMITASHNPAKYNGYKCYGPDGCQMTDVAAGDVYAEIQKVDLFNGVHLADFNQSVENGMIIEIGEDLLESYLGNVQAQSVNPGVCKGAGLKVVYTPLNGAGNKLVRRILQRIGVDDVSVVPEQENPDGNFPTCPYPNPEFREALELALKLADKQKPDLVLATDPDSDRVGIAVKQGEGYRLMTGNETGIMLIHYILSCRKQAGTLPERPVAVKTIVTSEMVTRIAEKYGCELRNVLTGFKYIGEQILNLEQAGEADRYVFGFEESYGYLAGTYVRDKDAVVASMLICEMAAYYRMQGKSLSDVMNELYAEYGYYQNTTLNFAFEGAAGMEKMQQVMGSLRKNPPDSIAGRKVVRTADYQQSKAVDLTTGLEEEIKLPKSNVLSYFLEGGAAAIVRPSGTEPKIKVYVTSVGADEQDAAAITKQLADEMTGIIQS